MKTLQRIEVTKAAEPLDYEKLFHPSTTYNIQNMLARQVNFPEYFHKGDVIYSYWQDRMNNGDWQRAYEWTSHSSSKSEWNGWLAGCSEKDFLLWLSVANYTELRSIYKTGRFPRLTGGRVVTFSDAGGFHVKRFDLFFKGKDTPEVPLYSGTGFAPNVEGYEKFLQERRADRFRFGRRFYDYDYYQ